MAPSKRNDTAVEVIRARPFALVDETGRVIATFGAEHGTEGEGASLAIYDAEGRGRVWITGYQGGGNVHIVGAEDDDRFLQLENDGLHTGRRLTPGLRSIGRQAAL